MSSRSATGYHLETTGQAAKTAAKHAVDKVADPSIEFMGACFCPFVQRAWIALEVLNQGLPDDQSRKASKVDYAYVEIDPYKKPKELLEVSPKGLVPAARLGQGKSLHDSLILMHYLASLPLSTGENPLLPKGPYERARVLLAGQRHAETITPAFYRYLQAQEAEKQVEHGKEFTEALEAFEKDMNEDGPFFFGKDLGWVDILIAPWAIRFGPVLEHYRQFSPPVISDKSRRFVKWLDAIKSHPAVAATTSTDELYTDSYHRYAKNIPNLSQVADAINSGKALP
ncbi:glutathione S-transferase [Filobasidium floriforme]|uniref:glutathione S-transferase n=1 Tax=Filobasidium floriforme TaxID=5210 RepID=UPI001E8D2928|nr:glutathione S-transferase [Filobasidium floriforme]KAH8080848.1 glutathione S-transferase [Filobasidium floriforme]